PSGDARLSRHTLSLDTNLSSAHDASRRDCRDEHSQQLAIQSPLAGSRSPKVRLWTPFHSLYGLPILNSPHSASRRGSIGSMAGWASFGNRDAGCSFFPNLPADNG